MTHRTLLAAALLGLCFVGTATAADADASAPCGMFVLTNPTDVRIVYEVKWGDGEWVRYTLEPNHLRKHSYPLSAKGRAPSPAVRFDARADDGKVTWKDVPVHFGRVAAAQGVDESVRYTFTNTTGAIGLRGR